MVVALDVQVDATKALAAFKLAPRVIALGIVDGLKRALQGFRNEFLQREAGIQITRGRAGLGNRWMWPVKAEGDTTGTKLDALRVSLYTRSKAAELMEKGGTVRPKQGRYLALPLDRALGPKGTRKKKAYRSPTHALAAGKEFVTFRGRSGKLIMYEKLKRASKGRRLIPTFVLLPQVTFRPKLGFFAAWARHGKADITRRISLSMDKALNQAFRTGP